MSPVPPGIVIRVEAPGDAAAIRALTDAAFAPSTLEGRIVDALREDAAAWIPDLSLVAVDEAAGGRIVGHCVTTVGSLHAAATTEDASPILGLGPISVAPERQGQGIGGALIHETIEPGHGRRLAGHRPARPRDVLPAIRVRVGARHRHRTSRAVVGRALDGPPPAGLVARPERHDALPASVRHRLMSMAADDGRAR